MFNTAEIKYHYRIKNLLLKVFKLKIVLIQSKCKTDKDI